MSDRFTPDDQRQAATRFRDRYEPGNVVGLLIAGSGLRIEVPGWTADSEIDLTDVFPFPVHSLEGHRQTVSLWRHGEDSVLVTNGRFHLYQGYPVEQVVAPVRLAAILGARVMIATNATGSLDPDLPPGSLVVVSDHLNLFGTNPLVGEWGRAFGPQFPDMSESYDPDLRRIALEAGHAAGFNVAEGIYAGVPGPSFETPAEIRMLRTMGGTVVGMSTVPEVIAARHMGLRVLVLSLAANPAAGLVDRPLSHSEVLEAGRQAASRLSALIGVLVEKVF